MVASRKVFILAISLSVLAIALALMAALVGIMLATEPSYNPYRSPVGQNFDIVMGLTFALVGCLIAVKRPGNLIGWALLLAGLGLLSENLLRGYSELAVIARPDANLPAGRAAGAIASACWTLLMNGVFMLVLLFPSGSLPSRRWRVPSILVPALFAFVFVALVTLPGLDSPLQDLENPLAITQSRSHEPLIAVAIGVCLVCLVAAVIDLLVRFWRSQGDERQQYKWLASSSLLVVITLPFAAATYFEGLAGVLIAAALMALPISVAIAILRYRLYDIDLLINRSLVYVPLTAILAGLFVAMTGLSRALLTSVTDAGSDAAIAMTTLGVVALLTPLKNQLQAFVDKHFKERQEPRRQLDKLAEETQAVLRTIDTDEFARYFLEKSTVAMEAEGGAIELRGKPGLITAGDWQGVAALTLSLAHDGHELGTLSLAGHRRGRAYVQADIEALQQAVSILARAMSLRGMPVLS